VSMSDILTYVWGLRLTAAWKTELEARKAATAARKAALAARKAATAARKTDLAARKTAMKTPTAATTREPN
jgi:hypothetical protein